MGKSDSKLVAHARHELEKAKAFDKNDDYDGSIGRGVLALIKVFDQWFGGDSAKANAAMMGFQQLMSGELLSPPTTDPAEWDVVEGAAEGTVRNNRCPFYVSTDNGKTWMHLQNKERGDSRNHLTGKDVKNGNDGKSSTGEKSSAASDSEATKDTVSTPEQSSPDGDQGSSESPAAQDGSGLDAGVETEGAENQSGPESTTPESEKRKEE
jgi:hypothetical protein